MTSNPVYLSLEFTPNPNTLKYAVNQTLLPTTYSKPAANFTTPSQAAGASPLAEALFKIEGIEGVLIGRDFVTITKSESGDWERVHKLTSSTIESHLTAGLPVLTQTDDASAAGSRVESELDRQIRAFLDKEIRPAVAMDGGDVVFDRFEAGVVYLHLQGSCAGCPSATATLKHGIEARLKEVIPHVREVVQVQ